VIPAPSVWPDVSSIEHMQNIRISQRTLAFIQVSYDHTERALPKSRKDGLRMTEAWAVSLRVKKVGQECASGDALKYLRNDRQITPSRKSPKNRCVHRS